MRRLCTSVVVTLLAVSFVVGSMVKSYGYTETEVTNGGTISGTVKLAGDVPAAKMLKADKDQEACGHPEKPSEALVVSADTKGIKSAVVSIENIEKGKKFNPPSSNPTLDQKECTFIPHLLAVPVGTTLEILNSDKVMHNTHSYAIKNAPFNEGVTGGGKLLKKFEFPELVPIKCDVHKWMTAFVVVKDNPYFAITDDNGNFKIDNVPPGTYKLQAWQEKLGKVVQDITVEAGKEAKVDFELKAK